MPDSYSHWLTCTNASLITEIINSSVHHILSLTDLNLTACQLQELSYKICTHPAFDQTPFQPNSHFRNLILKGLIPQALIHTFQNYNISTRIASKTITKILLHINDQVYN